jgi:hypothetical protein
MKRILLFVGLKIGEVIGAILAFTLLAGIFKLCDMWFFNFYPFRDGEYWINPIKEWAYCGWWGFLWCILIAMISYLLVRIVGEWVKANWIWAGKLTKKGNKS